MVFKQDNGFTFVELLLSVLILAGAIGGALLLYTSSMISSQQAWDTTVATSHAEYVLEDMQTRDSISNILAVDWESWVVKQRLNTLPSEAIEVTFVDPESDPLDVQVTVDWIRKLRVNRITLKTRITK